MLAWSSTRTISSVSYPINSASTMPHSINEEWGDINKDGEDIEEDEEEADKGGEEAKGEGEEVTKRRCSCLYGGSYVCRSIFQQIVTNWR